MSDHTRSSVEVKALLDAKGEAIQNRVRTIKSEFAPVANVTENGRASVADEMLGNLSPATKKVAIGLAVGFVVSIFVVGKVRGGRKKRRRQAQAIQSLSNEILEKAGRRVSKGEQTSGVMADEIARAVPELSHTVVEASSPSRIVSLLSLAAKTAGSYAAKQLLSTVSESLRMKGGKPD